MEIKAATPEYVLAVMRSQARLEMNGNYDCEPAEPLTFSTSFSDYFALLGWDLPVTWREFGSILNDQWGISLSIADWKSVLKPYSEQTLGDVCQMLARHVVRPTVKPVTLFGSRSAAAGHFLKFRSLLKGHGTDDGKIGPSTPLDHVDAKQAMTLLFWAARVAPGSVGRIIYHDPAGTMRVRCGVTLALIMTVAAYGATGHAGCGLAAALLAIPALMCISGFLSVFIHPPTVEVERLRTFGDLARAVADCERTTQSRWSFELKPLS